VERSAAGRVVSGCDPVTRISQPRGDMRTREEAVCSYPLIPIPCPDCGGPMRISAVVPADLPVRADELTYRCDACDCDLKRWVSPPKTKVSGSVET
jgi:hypothetical protein